MTEELVAEQQPQDAASSPASSGAALPASPNGAMRELAGKIALGATGLAPKTMAELLDFAQLMARGGPTVGKAFRNNPGACLGITMQAMRWGMDPFAVSQKAYVTGDNIAYEAQLVLAVINAHAPITERLKPTFSGEGSTLTCTLAPVLKGEKAPSVYVSPQFGQITTKNSPLWKTDPSQQLFYYSARAWARRFCPEIILGVYDPEEMQEAQRAHVVSSEPIANADGIDQRPPEEIARSAAEYEEAIDGFLRGEIKDLLVAHYEKRFADAKSEGEVAEIEASFRRKFYNNTTKKVSALTFNAIEAFVEAAEKRLADEETDRQQLAEQRNGLLDEEPEEDDFPGDRK